MSADKIDKITKLTEQYNKELELIDKHRKKAKSLSDQIKYMKGEECNGRINRLNLTPEQFNKVLRLLDNKTKLMDAVEMCLSQEKTGQNAGETETEVSIPGAEDEPIEVPVFGEEAGEGDEKVS